MLARQRWRSEGLPATVEEHQGAVASITSPTGMPGFDRKAQCFRLGICQPEIAWSGSIGLNAAKAPFGK